MTQLQSEIQQISTTTQYNGINLLDGSLTNLQFQVGANAGQTIDLGLASAEANSIGTNIYNAGDSSLTGGNPTVLTPVIGTATVTNGVVTGGTVANAVTAAAINIAGNQTLSVTPTAGEQVSAIASSINEISAQTGVSATAATSAEITGFATGSVSLNLYYGEESTGTVTGGTTNSVSINAQVTAGTGQAGYQDIINQINQNTGTTGVTATYDNGTNGPGIILSNNTGNDIAVANLSNATTQAGLQLSGLSYTTANTTNPTTTQTPVLVGTAALGNDAFGLVAGTLQLSSAEGFSVSGNTTVLGSAAANPIASQFASVGGANLSTTTNGQPTGANLALAIIDSAISQIDTARSNVGAYQNRFTAAVSNLQSSALNLTSSLSTEEDTNFAAETTNLSRGQILQQAGTAMLAQANSLPNGVLALLR
jgi:flagellin